MYALLGQTVRVPKPRKNPQQRILTSEEVTNAIWIYFEGNKGQLPTLLGVINHSGAYRVIVLESLFHDAQNHAVRFGEVTAGDLLSACVQVCTEAKNAGLPIISWSRREILARKRA
jgi:hypothetical protein